MKQHKLDALELKLLALRESVNDALKELRAEKSEPAARKRRRVSMDDRVEALKARVLAGRLK